MKHISATPPPKLQNKKLYILACIYALVIVVCMLGQLYRFDNILSFAGESNISNSQIGVVFWTVLQMIQLFALPFLLRIHISSLMRIVSMIAAMLVPIFWAILAGWQLSVGSQVVGIFGTEVEMLNVWWVTAIVATIGVVGFSASIASIATSKKQLIAILRK